MKPIDLEIIDPTFNRCNVLCEHGALCDLDLSHEGVHKSHAGDTLNCAWERTIGETQLTPEQAREHISAILGIPL